jgi:hypothetical protein
VHKSVPSDLIPLFVAAAIAYGQVFGKRRTEDVTPSTDELDLVALALSNHLPLFGRIDRQISEIPPAEVRRGMFWGGATRFESLQGRTIIGLAVSKSALDDTLSTISLDSL